MDKRKYLFIGILFLVLVGLALGAWFGRFRLAGAYIEWKTDINVVYIGETDYTTRDGEVNFVLFGTFNFGNVPEGEMPDNLTVLNKVMYLLVADKHDLLFMYFGTDAESPSLIHAYVLCPDMYIVRADEEIGMNCKIFYLLMPEFTKEEFVW
jgi:hypothetical protein